MDNLSRMRGPCLLIVLIINRQKMAKQVPVTIEVELGEQEFLVFKEHWKRWWWQVDRGRYSLLTDMGRIYFENIPDVRSFRIKRVKGE